MKFGFLSHVVVVGVVITSTVGPLGASDAFCPRSLVQRRRFLSTNTGSPPATTTTTTAKTTTTLFKNSDKILEMLAQKPVSDQQVEELLRSYGEKSRLYRRDVFTSADWIRYRRPDRFIDHLLSTYDSGLLRALQLEMLVLTTLSSFVVFYNDLFVNGIQGWNGQVVFGPILHLPTLQLPLVPFTLSTVALGLLLTFRTNVSYSRWNEARTAWGAVINDSRSLVRMGCIWAKSYNNMDDAALVRLGEAVCSFSRALMNRTLPPQEDSERFLQYTHTKIQDQQYAKGLRSAKHRPSAALSELTQILVEYNLNPIHQVEVERIVTGLCNSMGVCERIFSSPVPTFYTRHTARFLAVWLFCLPLGMYESFGSTWNHLGLIPACFGLGLFLLGIEELATQMEEPFSILPMENMCEASIRTPVMEQVERSIGSERHIDPSHSFRISIPSTTTISSSTTSNSYNNPTVAEGGMSLSAINAPAGEFPVEVLSKDFGIEFAVKGIQQILTNTAAATSNSNDDNYDIEDDDNLDSFFVAQPLAYNALPSAAAGQFKSPSFMPKSSSFKPAAGSGMPSYVDNISSNAIGQGSSNYPTPNVEETYKSNVHDHPEKLSSAAVEPLRYGGMPSATTKSSWTPSSPSYMPKSSYNPTPGTGMPSYFDNFNGDQVTYSAESYTNEKLETPPPSTVEPLRYGGMPSATTVPWKSTYMPNSSFKPTSGSGMPSYFDNFNHFNSNNDQGTHTADNFDYDEPETPPPATVEPFRYGGMPSAAATSWKSTSSSYMPNSSYKPTSGSGVPSYFDNFNHFNNNNDQGTHTADNFDYDEPETPSTAEPLRYGGMPSAAATSWKSTSSSYMPNSSYKPTSGPGMPSYFDNFNT
jgi:ion channel-forming bestrophin family protein